MGCYINPDNETKEKWLEENGELIKSWFPTDKVHFKPYEEYCVNNKLPVIIVDNGPFRAAGVCYNESKFKAFTDPSDPRPRMLYLVSIEDLKTVSDLTTYRKDLATEEEKKDFETKKEAIIEKNFKNRSKKSLWCKIKKFFHCIIHKENF